MLIGLSQQISKIFNPSLSLPSNHPIILTESAHNLGFMIDSSLTFLNRFHLYPVIVTIISTTFATSSTLLTSKQHLLSATSLVHSKLNYCNSLYLNLPQKQIPRLQLLQNSLARTVAGTPKTEHITPVLKSLHWLKIEERIHYKITSLTYNFLQTSQPQYLRKLINIKPAGSTRSSNHLTLLGPSTSYLNISNHSYNQTAPILWINLPKSMRTFSNILNNSAITSQCFSLPLSLSKTQFRSHLKPYLLASHTHLNLLSC